MAITHLQTRTRTRTRTHRLAALVIALLAPGLVQADETSITVADAPLDAAFYADGSCLLTIDALVQSGKTIIDANVDDAGSRMLIHCDTLQGRRLTLLARGDALNVAQRVPLLARTQIEEGEFGMIAWLTRSGAHYTDDSAPRRYVVAGNVLLRKSPPVDVAGYALHTERQSFAQLTGLLEPIIKNDSQLRVEPLPVESDDVSPNSIVKTPTPAAKKLKPLPITE